MSTLFRMVLFLWIIYLPLPLMACGPKFQIAKKPEGLRKNNPDPTNPYLTTQDRLMWKSVLNWCDECDERARPFTESNEKKDGRIFVNPMGSNQYIVDIHCYSPMHQSEHIYYKVTEHSDTIESQLLILEQFDYFPAEGEIGSGIEEPTEEPKGEFIRFYDSLTYGLTLISEKNKKHLIVERRYRALGGCGLYTVYDVSGDCPKVVDFRARPYCSANIVPTEKWKSYPPQERAKWRIVSNPLRENWEPSSTPACTE